MICDCINKWRISFFLFFTYKYVNNATILIALKCKKNCLFFLYKPYLVYKDLFAKIKRAEKKN